ncbi:MAG: hypothetical protein K0S74_797 [Chlamydiales bacterium]|nr:hypothetical protein [Chlamydiales bacterium]
MQASYTKSNNNNSEIQSLNRISLVKEVTRIYTNTAHKGIQQIAQLTFEGIFQGFENKLQCKLDSTTKEKIYIDVGLDVERKLRQAYVEKLVPLVAKTLNGISDFDLKYVVDQEYDCNTGIYQMDLSRFNELYNDNHTSSIYKFYATKTHERVVTTIESNLTPIEVKQIQNEIMEIAVSLVPIATVHQKIIASMHLESIVTAQAEINETTELCNLEEAPAAEEKPVVTTTSNTASVLELVKDKETSNFGLIAEDLNKSANSVNEEEELNGFICPITLEIMRDPVVASEGHTYEREVIEKWIKDNGFSPLTKELLSTNLIPNHNLRKAIQDYTSRIHSKQ